MSSTLEVIDSYLSLDSTQYAQAPIGATRIATLGDGVDLYGTIPTWTATNWEIEFDVVFPTSLASTALYILDSNDANNRRNFALNTGGIFFRVVGNYQAYLDGTLIVFGSTTHPLDGAVHSIKMVSDAGTNPTTIGTILARYIIANYGNSGIFNLRLTDLDNSANSRFYPMDEAYPTYTTTRQLFASDTLTVVTPSSIVVETGWVNEGGGVYYRPFSLEGDAIRFELPYPTGKTYLVTFDLEKEAGGEVKLVSDGTVKVNGSSGSYAVLITPTEHSGATGIRFARNNGTTGWGGRVKNIVFKEVANAGLWYNRAAGNVVTVYPEAIKPTDQVTFAIRFEATGGTADPFLFTLGEQNGTSDGIGVVLRTTTGKVEFFRLIKGAAYGESVATVDLGDSPVDGQIHIAVIKRTSASTITFYFDSLSTTANIGGATHTLAINKLTLNARIGSTVERIGEANIHYAYLYNGLLSDADIEALMAGENPMYVGDVRQGYNLAGNGDEVNGGPALTLYGAFDGDEWYVPRRGDKRLVQSIINSMINSMVTE